MCVCVFVCVSVCVCVYLILLFIMLKVNVIMINEICIESMESLRHDISIVLDKVGWEGFLCFMIISFNVFYTFNSYCNWRVMIFIIDWYIYKHASVKHFIIYICNSLHSIWMLITIYELCIEWNLISVCVCVCVCLCLGLMNLREFNIYISILAPWKNSSNNYSYSWKWATSRISLTYILLCSFKCWFIRK